MHREHWTNFHTRILGCDAITIGCLWMVLTYLRAQLTHIWPNLSLPGAPKLQDVEFIPHALLLVAIVPVWLIALHRNVPSHPGQSRSTEALWMCVTRAVAKATLLLLGLLFALGLTDDLSRTLVFGFATASIPALWASRRMILRSPKRMAGAQWNILVIGDKSTTMPLFDSIQGHESWGIRLAGTLGVPESHDSEAQALFTEQLRDHLRRSPIDQIFLNGVKWNTLILGEIAKCSQEFGVRLSMDANVLGLNSAKPHVDEFDGKSILSFSSTPLDSDALLIKRVMDIGISTVALALLAPFLGLVAFAIYLGDRGSVFFVQERVGKHGRTFPLVKFRTMIPDAEAQQAGLAHLNEMTPPAFKMKHDPRVTAIGRWLRKASVDELPQLWNVLTGDMSLVGPRPPICKEVEDYDQWQLRRLSMKPGLTCTWQVSGRNKVDFATWMKLDLAYIDNWSLLLDFRILLQTIPAVISRNGAR